MSGTLLRFRPRLPHDERTEALRIRADHHSLVVEMIDLELRARAAGLVDEAADLAPDVEAAAASLREFEQRTGTA